MINAGCGSTPAKVAATHEIKATDMAFGPDTVTIKEDEIVRVVLNNQGAQEHDITIDEPKGKATVVSEGGSHGASHEHKEFHVSAAPGKSGSLDFTPSEPGTYEFYCTVPGHKDAGMKGTLIVQ